MPRSCGTRCAQGSKCGAKAVPGDEQGHAASLSESICYIRPADLEGSCESLMYSVVVSGTKLKSVTQLATMNGSVPSKTMNRNPSRSTTKPRVLESESGVAKKW